MFANVLSQPVALAQRSAPSRAARGAAAPALPAAASSSFAGVRLSSAARARRAVASRDVASFASPRAMAVDVAAAPGAPGPRPALRLAGADRAYTMLLIRIARCRSLPALCRQTLHSPLTTSLN